MDWLSHSTRYRGAPSSYHPPPSAPFLVRVSSLIVALSCPAANALGLYLPGPYLVPWLMLTATITLMEGYTFFWKHGTFYPIIAATPLISISEGRAARKEILGQPETEKEIREEFNRRVDHQQFALALMPTIGTLVGILARKFASPLNTQVRDISLVSSTALGIIYWFLSPQPH